MAEHDGRSARLALARMRATGAAAQDSYGVPDQLAGAARLTGRRLVEISHHGRPRLALGWLDGHEPSTDPGSGITRRKAPQTELVVFAACLGCCWSDVHDHPWPGEPCDEVSVLEAVAAARGNRSSTALGGYRTALGHLSEALWIERRSGTVRLGPKTAVLTSAQVDILRSAHELLPRPTDTPPSEEST
ncbi:hypothetical protein [Nocardiopsis dassonvillei]|uniref:hypothetical protein n=1 Tax=Nocardiopsis dassonvillei TaxID=2014 RepID=UPI003630FA74